MAEKLQLIEVIACVSVAADPDFPSRAGHSNYTTGPCQGCGATIWIGHQSAALSQATGQPLLCVDCCAALAGSAKCERTEIKKLDPKTGKVFDHEVFDHER